MNITELKQQVEKMKPALSAEALMLVELIMPLCEALAKENAEQKAKIKMLEDELAGRSGRK